MEPLVELIGESPGILAVREQVRRLLDRPPERGRLPPVLIHGETGSGKGLLARAIHRGGPRRAGPFVDVNCAAIPDTLLEAELFGFERGAFTDARQAKAGLFQTAHRGTIFLDEVGLLPEPLQAKLLKVLEDKAVRRLGSTRSEPVDVWILSATNEELAAAVRARRFREDLYHRLAVVTLTLPPLRERGADVDPLADHFLARACADYGLRPKRLGPDARAALRAHLWPGNVRELGNVMERTALLNEADVVTAEMLGLGAPVDPSPGAASPASADPSLSAALDAVERARLEDALEKTGGNVTRAAIRLGISRDTLRYRLAKHALRSPGVARARRAVERPEEPEEMTETAEPAEVSPAPVASPVPAAPSPGPPAMAERRRLAFLRATLTFPGGADPRLYPSRAVEVLVDKAQGFGGRVVELSPTDLVAAFGLEPSEDAARRATLAAIAIQKAAQRAWVGGGDGLGIRAAVCVWPVPVSAASEESPIDPEAQREVKAFLERLMASAPSGSVTASETAARFLERHFDLTAVGAGFDGGHRAYLVAPAEGPGLGPGPRMASFVGRRRQLDLLRGFLDEALKGRGQVVGLLGEAGLGKSRLLYEFRRLLLDLRETEGLQVTYLEGRCRSYGSAVPYLPILDILRQNFRLTETDPPPVIVQKVRAGLEELEMAVDDLAPYVLRLLGVSEGTERLASELPAAVKARTIETLREMGLRGSRRRPLVFVVEDFHWSDSASEEALATLMESMLKAPALFVGTYRPGYRPPWAGHSYATQVALPPLSPDESRDLLRSVTRTDVSEALAGTLVERAGGNPFFLEELSRAIGSGRDPDGSADQGASARVAVPDTIEEVILARIDRLADGPRRVLQAAAVLGREMPVSLLQALAGPEASEEALRELARLEFLYPVGGAREPVYAFTHTLTQEVAYETLPVARRRALHLAAGETLERLFPGRLAEVLDRLAHHFARADRSQQALGYLTALADRAARGHAHTEAVRILEEALEQADRLEGPVRDRQRIELALLQAHSLFPLGRFPRIVELLLPEQERVSRLGDDALAGPFHFLLGRAYLFLGDDERAVRHTDLALAAAARAGDTATVGRVHYLLAQRGAMSGRPQEGLQHGRTAVARLTEAGEDWWLGAAHWMLGLNHGLLGDFAPALAEQARAEAIAGSARDTQVQSAAAWAIGIIHAIRGEGAAGVASCQRALALSPDPLNTALASGWLGYAHLEEQDTAQAIPRLEQALQLLAQFAFPQPQAWFQAFLAEAHRLEQKPAQALQLASQALRMARSAGSSIGIGWAERILGRIAQGRGAHGDADAHLTEALRLFEAIGARFDVGRTLVDLARLARAQGQPGAADAGLARAEAIFQELDVPVYLDRARALRRELGESPATEHQR